MKIDKAEVYGLYVHIPFCLKKCAYCDFASYPGLISRADCYLETVANELAHYRGVTADTVYIGGGTPTYLKKEQLIGLIECIKREILLTDDCEITVECNPKTADEEYFRQLLKVGVNRLSIGVQSFLDRELAILGRLHSAQEASDCVLMAKQAGFTNISLDLMFGLPKQSIQSFTKSIQKAIDLAPTHISSYSLILEEGTPLDLSIKNGEYRLPDEETERQMYQVLVSELKQAGYERYEISNFAKVGKESRHNCKYWERKPYIGIGAAAHSHLGNVRFGNPACLDDYEKVAGLVPPNGRESEHLAQKDEMAEFMFLGLRKMCGVSQKQFFELFRVPMMTVFSKPIEKFVKLGILEETKEGFRLSDRGIDVSNSVFCEFLPD